MDMQSNHQPWQKKGVSKNARLMARVGLYLTSVMTLFWFIASVYFVIAPSPKTGDFWNDTFPYICLAGIVGGLIFATIKLFRLSFAPISFTPSYPSVNPIDSGKPIDALFEQTPGQGRAFSFVGSITFRPEGLEIPFFLPLKGRTSVTVPYAQITKMNVKGRHVAFEILEDEYMRVIIEKRNYKYATVENVKSNPLYKISRSIYKPKTAFYVSEADGERMYRELKKYFPSAVAEYAIW